MILFLSWWTDIKAEIGLLFENGLRWIFYVIGQFLYKLVIDLYTTFQLLCNARIIDSDVMTSIATRVGLILGIVMLFIVIFSFIKMLIDPDMINDKKNGAVSIIKKSIIVIVLLGSSQFIFDGLFRIQRIIISENIISKIILPNKLDTENFGARLAEEVFMAFYQVDSRLIDEETKTPLNSDVEKCADAVNQLTYGIYTYGNFDAGRVCLTETIEITQSDDEKMVDAEINIIDYNFLLSTGAAIGLIWFLFSYCISVGMRVIQLLVLEIMSPMAIISYLSPKDDNMFKKWWKLYASTYIDVFLRIAIINFAAFLIGAIFDNWKDGLFLKSIGNPTGRTLAFIMVIMIIAILSFAKKAPELLKNLFPSSGSGLGFGFTSPKNLLGAMAGGALISSLGKRGFGSAAVGTGRAIGNMRNTIGKAITASGESKTDRKNAKAALAAAKNSGNAEQIKAARAQLREANAKRNLWIGRTFGGAIGGLAGGAIAGARTTSASGRKQSVKSGVAATKSKYKVRDAGYGSSIPGLFTETGREGASNYIKDIPKKMFNMDDTKLEQMTKAAELAVSSQSRSLMALQEKYNGEYTVTRLSNGSYNIVNKKGGFVGESLSGDEVDSFFGTQNHMAKQIADKQADLGAAESRLKALTQEKAQQDNKKS